MTHPFQHDVGFRNRLNWLHNGGSGALGVTYIPPPPDILPSIMNGIMHLVNCPPSHVNPLILGSLVSFAFVFAHPFMDGNGRLSRFLFHKVVCTAHRMHGMVLPISMAMQRNEKDYLRALQSFSNQARRLWQVLMIDEGQFDFQFTGDTSIYRYWDATPCIEFGLQMAEQALEIDLKTEARFLQQFDAAYQRIRREIDLNNHTLSLMIRLTLLNKGTLSNNKRKMFEAKGVPESLLTRIETICSEVASRSEAQ
jgi:Fic family protein